MRFDPLVLDILFLLHIGKYLFIESSLSVVVPKAMGISLHNKIGDSVGEFLVVVLWGFLSTFNDFELLLFLCFCVESGGMYAW